jgi:hypothetical protein
MTARAIKCPSPCGGYVVEIVRDRIVVDCAICGRAGRFTPTGARALARELAGPLGRFQTTAPRAERLRLAANLKAAADKLQGRPPAKSRKPRNQWSAPCGCSYRRYPRSSVNSPCSAHNAATNAAKVLAPANRRYV